MCKWANTLKLRYEMRLILTGKLKRISANKLFVTFIHICGTIQRTVLGKFQKQTLLKLYVYDVTSYLWFYMDPNFEG